MQELWFRGTQSPLAMSELQSVGYGEAAAQLRRGLEMDLSMGLIAWCALFAALGAAGTWMARAYALQRQLLDEPGARRSHRVATPRGGGIAIALAFLVALVAMVVRSPARSSCWLVPASACCWSPESVGSTIIARYRPGCDSRYMRLRLLGWVPVYLSGASGAVAMTTFVSALVLVNILPSWMASMVSQRLRRCWLPGPSFF